MTNYFWNTDWREKVAAMTATNDQDIEKAFSDQASGFVENAVGDLMKDQHRVGFEIVKKNDDNTRMVGIFAFKVDQDLVYAPVFFLNGEIKGPLLYRASTKTFVPANKEWANYLIESMELHEGKGRDVTRRSDSNPLVRMRDIAFRPPGMGKQSSVIENEDKDVSAKEDKDAKKTLPTPGKNSNGDTVNDPTTSKNKEIKDPVLSLLPEGTKVINVPAKWKKIDAPCDCLDGEREVPGMYGKPTGQPELTTGETVVKMANWDDGTVRFELADRWEPLTKAAADALREGAASFNVSDPDIELSFDKEAAASIVEFIDAPSNRAEKSLLDCIDKIASFMEQKGLIREFLSEPDFGSKAAMAIIKAAEANFNFADAIAGIYPSPEDMLPKKFTTTAQEKVAAAGELAMYYDLGELQKSAAYEDKDLQEFFKSGAVLKDTRDKGALSVVTEEVVPGIQAPDSAGVYSILMQDGTFLDNVFVAGIYSGPFGREASPYDECCCSPFSSKSSSVTYILIHEGKVTVAKDVYGIKTGGDLGYSGMKDKVSGKKFYFAYVPNMEVVLGPIAVFDTKTIDGVQHCRADYHSYQDSYDKTSCYLDSASKTSPITINPDLKENDLPGAVFGKDVKFIEVKYDFEENCCHQGNWERGGSVSIAHLEGVGNSKSIKDWIFNSFGVNKVTIKKDLDTEKSAAYTISDGTRTSDLMHRRSLLIKLAADCGIAGEKAYELVERVDEVGKVDFYLEPCEKRASHLVLAERPNMDDEYDSEFGIPLVPEKKFILRVHGEQMQETPSSIGDAWDPMSPTGLPNMTVATAEPEDLQNIADVYHLPNVFEHGVIGTLADTFNATYLLDKYLGRIEDAVDVLGRIKFLIYWCPGDFENAYGTDDMANFEAEVDSNFDNLGAFYLKLLKKSDKKRQSRKQDSEKAQ